MATPERQGAPYNKRTVQHIQNYGFDEELKVPVVLPLSAAGTTLFRGNQPSLALRMDEGATYTYIGEAVPGTATSAATWRIKRLTNSDNTIVWADGDSNFNNVWDNRASLSYS